MKYKIVILFLSLSLLASAKAANILSVSFSPSKSHIFIHSAIAETLADAGHNVTVLANVPNMLPRAKYNYIYIEGPMYDNSFALDIINKPESIYKKFPEFLHMFFSMANATLNNPKMLQFLHTHGPGDYDAVVLGYFFNDFFMGIGAHFQCPIILSWMLQPIFVTNDIIGNPEQLSYVPALYSGLKQPMNFWARLKNFIAIAYEKLVLSRIMAAGFGKLYE